MTISQWLSNAAQQLSLANIPSPKLDAELLLCHMLGVDRTWLIAHGDDSLAMSALSRRGATRRSGIAAYGEQLLLMRLKRIPIAYITGHKEFYGRDFILSPDTLVPRPETESLIELAKKHGCSGMLLDVGTGSGCLGLTLALELPDSQLTVSDISSDALEIAKKNAKALGVKPVQFIVSDLLSHWLSHDDPKPFNLIAANLPYVDRSWTDTSPEIKHEPDIALYAGDGGLALIKRLIDEAPRLLVSGGHLLLEADPNQHDDIIHYASVFNVIDHEGYGLLLQLS